MLAVAGLKKRTILFGGVGAVLMILAVVLYFSVVGGGATSNATASDSGSWWNTAKDGVVDSRPEHLASVARISRSGCRRPYAGDTLRDPMVALATEASATNDAREVHRPAPVTTLPYMILGGIVWDAQSPVVMLDGDALGVGDEIKGARITEIGFDRVVLTYKGKRFELIVE